MNQPHHIPIIWLEGLHRSGKWTEIDLLINFFIESWCSPILRKWHGTRDGLWKDGSDPTSKRWQINSPKLKDKTLPNYHELRIEAAEKLQSEMYDTYQTLQLAKRLNPVLLLDRTILSRYFTEKQFSPTCEFNSLLSYHKSTSNGTWEIQKTIIPDIIFILECSLDTLKNRFSAKESITDKWAFRRENIQQSKFDLFQSIIHDIPTPLKDKVVIIDGNRKPPEVHKEIEIIIKEKFPGYFTK